MTQTTENKALTRSGLSDETMARWVKGEGATLSSISELFGAEGINVWDDEGDGIYTVPLIKDKDFLRGLPFLITRWRFNTSDKFKDDEGNDGIFVSVEIAYQTAPDAPVQTGVFNDGSTGVCRQLQNITDSRVKSGKGDPFAGRGVKGGLRISEYMRDTGKKDKGGQPVMEAASTYYLDF